MRLADPRDQELRFRSATARAKAALSAPSSPSTACASRLNPFVKMAGLRTADLLGGAAPGQAVMNIQFSSVCCCSMRVRSSLYLPGDGLGVMSPCMLLLGKSTADNRSGRRLSLASISRLWDLNENGDRNETVFTMSAAPQFSDSGSLLPPPPAPRALRPSGRTGVVPCRFSALCLILFFSSRSPPSDPPYIRLPESRLPIAHRCGCTSALRPSGRTRFSMRTISWAMPGRSSPSIAASKPTCICSHSGTLHHRSWGAPPFFLMGSEASGATLFSRIVYGSASDFLGDSSA